MSVLQLAVLSLFLVAEPPETQATFSVQLQMTFPRECCINRLFSEVFDLTAQLRTDDGVTVADVAELVKNGVSDEVVLNQIRVKGTTYDLSTKDLILLTKNKVSDRVVIAMQNTRADKSAAPSPCPPAVAPVTPVPLKINNAPPSQLRITVDSEKEAPVGADVPVSITITNIGASDLENVIVKVKISEGLTHIEGNQFQTEIKKISAGDSRRIRLTLRAAMPGEQSCLVIAESNISKSSPAEAKVKIVPGKVTLSMQNLETPIVQNQTTVELKLCNLSEKQTAPIVLACSFPEGLEFSSASDNGTYDAATRTVKWNMGCAPGECKRKVSVTTKVTASNSMAIRAVAQVGESLYLRAEKIIAPESAEKAKAAEPKITIIVPSAP